MPEGIVYFNAPSAGQWGAPALVANRWIVSWPVDGTNYSVLIHDTTTDTNSTVAIGSSVLFVTAAVGGDGHVYAAATTGTNIYKLNTSTWTLSTISYGATARSWRLVADNSGDIWGLPAASHTHRLFIDVSAGTATEASFGGTGVTTSSAAVGSDGNIWAVISASVSGYPVLKLNTSTGTVTSITPTGGSGGRLWAGLTNLSDGRLIAFNNGSSNNAANGYIIINPSTSTAAIHSRPWANINFASAAQDPAGDVYAISTGSPVIAVVDPSVPSASVHGTTPAGTTSTLITASTGVIYAMPGGSNNATRIEAGVVTEVTGTGSVGSTRNPAFQVGAAIYAVTSTNSGLNTIVKITDVIPPSKARRGFGLIR